MPDFVEAGVNLEKQKRTQYGVVDYKERTQEIEMQPIKIWFTDFWAGYRTEDNLFINILKQKYPIVLDEKEPDFLFCSCFDGKHFNYDCVKIFFTGENITPDFNLYDYAIGFDRLTFGDRYFRLPLYRMYGSCDQSAFDDAFFEKEASSKKKFCNFLYSNSTIADDFRIRLLDAVSEYKNVECGGNIRNNIGHRVEDKIAWQRDFKFSIACENSSKGGYVTEKIFDALRTHTIPIYWGDPDIALEFNPKRFINCHDYDSLDTVVAEVKRLDEDSAAYLTMLKEPWFEKETPLQPESDPVFLAFLYNIIDQGREKARRTTPYGWTSHHYDRIKYSYMPSYKKKSNTFWSKLKIKSPFKDNHI